MAVDVSRPSLVGFSGGGFALAYEELVQTYLAAGVEALTSPAEA